MKILIVCKSIHHGNTEKIAKAMVGAMSADLMEPNEIQDIEGYDLVGFGSGIYHSRHHQSLFDLINKFSDLRGKKVFVFSTAGMIREINHRSLKEALEEKNAKIIDEFSCKGHDSYSFLKYFGGINKGRPNENDLKEAKEFAKNLV